MRQSLQHFIRNARHHRNGQHTAQDASHKGQLLDSEQRKEQLIGNRADEDGDEHHQKQERRSAARMQAGELACVFRGQRKPRFIAVYGLMFRAMIHEHALDIRHKGDGEHIADQNRNARQACGQVDEQAAVRRLADERRHAGGQRNEQEHAHDDCQHHGNRHDHLVDARAELIRQPLFKPARLLIHHAEHLRAFIERFHAHFEHHDHVHAAANQWKPHPLMLFGKRFAMAACDHDFAVGSANGNGDGFIRRALHHDALHDRLSADILILYLFTAHFDFLLFTTSSGRGISCRMKFSRPVRRPAVSGGV